MKRLSAGMDLIAKRIGVSKTTVHYALHNTGRISTRLRKRILDLAQKLNYRPNLLARSLRSKRTATIGVVAVHLSSSYHANVVAGIEDAARLGGRSILLACSYDSAEREREAVQLLIDKGVDGVIVAPAVSEANIDFYRKLAADGTAIVFVDRYLPSLNIASVATDNLMGGRIVAQHLLSSGRRRFGIVQSTREGPLPTSAQSRIEAFNRVLSDAGVDAAIQIGPETFNNTSEGAYRAVQRFLKDRGVCVDAVFATHDLLAFGAVRALVEHGARVPDDVAIAGFDDQEPSAYFQPALTTVRQPMREIGAEATRLLVRQMEEPSVAGSTQQILLKPELVVRQSCGTKLE